MKAEFLTHQWGWKIDLENGIQKKNLKCMWNILFCLKVVTKIKWTVQIIEKNCIDDMLHISRFLWQLKLVTFASMITWHRIPWYFFLWRRKQKVKLHFGPTYSKCQPIWELELQKKKKGRGKGNLKIRKSMRAKIVKLL